MKSVYVVGGVPDFAKAIETTLSGEYETVFFAQENPARLKNFSKCGAFDDEKSIDILREEILHEAKGSGASEAHLVILANISSRDWRKSFVTNEYLPAALSEDFAKATSEMNLDDVSIALFGSSSAYHGGKIAYSATKASLTGVIHTLSRDFSPAIRANLIIPSAFYGDDIADWSAEKIVAVARGNMRGRLGSSEEMAGAIKFTIANKFLTNSVVNMTGGVVLME